ncbi:ABC-three component system protein [Bdellovibrio bacteriovorus]|uniref:ABC-three component system protein n=1 Tax=Bdellovibrio bacteriovorus TaxID=959 RepID=UPI003AA97DDB
MKYSYERQILALNDSDLEQFTRDYVAQKSSIYLSVERISGAGDKGRDVVGFLTKDKHEGPWHNYQCKQYGNKLPTATAMNEIGKVLYFAWQGDFTPPSAFYFVAPKGLNRKLRDFILNPSHFKKELLQNWNKYCAEKIIENQKIALTPELSAFIEAYDFSLISQINLSTIISDKVAVPVLYEWFKADPGPAPRTTTPPSISDFEFTYISALYEVYAEEEGVVNFENKDLSTYPRHKSHLLLQRERFYEAEVFKRFYRDNTNAETIDRFEEDIYQGVVDTFESGHKSSLERVQAVMSQAARINPTGILTQYAYVPVRQGFCHHFVNYRGLKWKR